jgi:hypothetical protein
MNGNKTWLTPKLIFVCEFLFIRGNTTVIYAENADFAFIQRKSAFPCIHTCPGGQCLGI